MSKPTSSSTSRAAQLALSSSLSIFPFGKSHEWRLNPCTKSAFVRSPLSSTAPHVGIWFLYSVNAS